MFCKSVNGMTQVHIFSWCSSRIYHIWMFNIGRSSHPSVYPLLACMVTCNWQTDSDTCSEFSRNLLCAQWYSGVHRVTNNRQHRRQLMFHWQERRFLTLNLREMTGVLDASYSLPGHAELYEQTAKWSSNCLYLPFHRCEISTMWPPRGVAEIRILLKLLFLLVLTCAGLSFNDRAYIIYTLIYRNLYHAWP